MRCRSSMIGQLAGSLLQSSIACQVRNEAVNGAKLYRLFADGCPPTRMQAGPDGPFFAISATAPTWKYEIGDLFGEPGHYDTW